MGDFEDVFGAGADAARIIDNYSSRRLREEEWEGYFTEEEVEAIQYQASMLARGYRQGPRFASYKELSEWDRTNQRPHVRRRTCRGYEVYFTDGKV